MAWELFEMLLWLLDILYHFDEVGNPAANNICAMNAMNAGACEVQESDTDMLGVDDAGINAFLGCLTWTEEAPLSSWNCKWLYKQSERTVIRMRCVW